MSMRFLSLVGNSFGCSASGERLVTAARDGDIQEAKALLDYNPRLARYSTFGVRNSPLHYSAAQGHHEIVTLLLKSGVDINLRNYRGQTALMQACQYGHWEVVQTLILYKANIHRADYLNGGTALHLAALNGHSRCVRLLLADYVPSTPNFYHVMKKRSRNKDFTSELDEGALYEVINRPADGGITALHMATLNGHAETVQLLLDLGASVSEVTVEDGSTIDLIGAGSTPLHYAACGGNAQCCQLLIARGATLTARNANGWTPLMVAQSWHRDWLHEILSSQPENPPQPLPSPYLCLPLMNIVNIARECGWTTNNPPLAIDPCVVCLERKCTVAAEGCFHEFCTQCALYLCSTSTTSTTGHGPPGAIPCPLCRHGIVSFVKLADTKPAAKETARTNMSLPFCSCSADGQELDPIDIAFSKPDFYCARVSPSSSFRSSSFQKFPLAKFTPGLCMGVQETSPSLVSSNDRRSVDNNLTRCSRSSFRRSNTERRRWLCSFSQSVETGNSRC
ncbi:probable E3 ubiquitin-protein ligase XBOS32 [Ipomoea triloba]|uniref:probable E3 ubiquitin-protein ligase XBOS32 n=1 Tax=Ipomoea triloba TaxID=35885 RepID=UPI00125D6A56|nr:probable E3 ubiquitin-protein ligase XBOS32 [Ipomoea triloba]XP_031109694.1 probable E3 ubiquitin-protein ligase XBOS32 [Ipomoea triloba]GME03572.1 probable E3 ubiquitin-protein ligase XBOS32 [Ipomoea batatas]